MYVGCMSSRKLMFVFQRNVFSVMEHIFNFLVLLINKSASFGLRKIFTWYTTVTIIWLCAGGVIVSSFFENEEGRTETVNGERMKTDYFWHELEGYWCGRHVVSAGWCNMPQFSCKVTCFSSKVQKSLYFTSRWRQSAAKIMRFKAIGFFFIS